MSTQTLVKRSETLPKIATPKPLNERNYLELTYFGLDHDAGITSKLERYFNLNPAQYLKTHFGLSLDQDQQILAVASVVTLSGQEITNASAKAHDMFLAERAAILTLLDKLEL